MSRVEPIAREPAPGPEAGTSPAPAVRTALVSTRRLARLFPSPALDASGRPTTTRIGRLSARARHGLRLLWVRAQFHFHWAWPDRRSLVQFRMRLRLAMLRLRHRRTLGR